MAPIVTHSDLARPAAGLSGAVTRFKVVDVEILAVDEVAAQITLTLRVETWRNYNPYYMPTRGLAVCPPVWVFAYDQAGRELGHVHANANDLDPDCTVQARMGLDPSFDGSTPITLRTYWGAMSLDTVRAGEAEVIAESDPITLVPTQQGRESGLYADPSLEESWTQSIAGIGGKTKGLAYLAAAGVGLYVLMPLLPALRAGTSVLAGGLEAAGTAAEEEAE